MSVHLTSTILNSLADGELSAEQCANAQRHLAQCPECTSSALVQTLLKSAVAKSGHRYAPPPDLAERLKRIASVEHRQTIEPKLAGKGLASWPPRRVAWAGWAVAAMLLIAGLIIVERGVQRSLTAAARDARVTEVCDLHIATLAAGLPPQVISSDRHTVKPWFQGKLPFSFNLPEQLPGDIRLEGANLTYLENQPVAQLLYSIGQHRVSVFVRQSTGQTPMATLQTDRSGFHINGIGKDGLDLLAVSDVEPTRLSELVGILSKAQRQ